MRDTQLSLTEALELIEDFANDTKDLLWAFHKDGEKVYIYQPPSGHSEFTVENDGIVVSHVHPKKILSWLPACVISLFLNNSEHIEVELEQEKKITTLQKYISEQCC